MAIAIDKDFPNDATLLVSFVPNRSRILGVRIGNVAFEQVFDEKTGAGRQRRLWSGRITEDVKNRKCLDVEFIGEPPEILLVHPVVGGAQELDAEITEIEQAVDKSLLDLLEARAGLEHRNPKITAARQMFFRFDAWTSAPIATQLSNPEFFNQLSPRARQVFRVPAERPARLLGQFDRLAGLLYLLACDRAYYLYKGLTPPADPISDPPTQTAMRGLARYLRPLLALPAAVGGPPAADAELSKDLEQAIQWFGCGALHCVKPNAKGMDALLNAEPDSAYFFVFADFAVRSIQFDPKNATFWFSLARLFTALQESFVSIYAKPGMPRAHCSYRRVNRREVKAAELDAIHQRIEYYRQQMPNRNSLPQLERRFATTILWALYDEIVWPQTTCTDSTLG